LLKKSLTAASFLTLSGINIDQSLKPANLSNN
jgi:hypothetical protein